MPSVWKCWGTFQPLPGSKHGGLGRGCGFCCHVFCECARWMLQWWGLLGLPPTHNLLSPRKLRAISWLFCSVVFMAFWPCFPGIGMDYRKLLADASCELVEQVISFRELFERRHALFLYGAAKFICIHYLPLSESLRSSPIFGNSGYLYFHFQCTEHIASFKL